MYQTKQGNKKKRNPNAHKILMDANDKEYTVEQRSSAEQELPSSSFLPHFQTIKIRNKEDGTIHP